MKRLLLITLIIITCVLAGILHGGTIKEEVGEQIIEGYYYSGNVPENMPDVIFDSTVIPAPFFD